MHCFTVTTTVTLTKFFDQINQLHDTIEEEYIAYEQVVDEFPNKGLISHYPQQKGANHGKL